jgi:hypothetical protein
LAGRPSSAAACALSKSTLGPQYKTIYDSDQELLFEQVSHWAQAAAFQKLPLTNVSVPLLKAELAANKPVIVGKANSGGSHLVTVIGLEGDGSPSQTFVKFIDPDGGLIRTSPFSTFAKEFESLAPSGQVQPPQLFRVL